MAEQGPRATEAHMETARVLWEASHRLVSIDRVRAAVVDGANLTTAAVTAVDQRLGPLLWRALEAAGCLDRLGNARSWLGAVAEACRVEARLLVPRAAALALTPLISAGLEPVVLKGPALAARYPEPGLRPMDDIDVLLPRSQQVVAGIALRAAGWREARGERRDLYDTVFVHETVSSMPLELHHSFEGTTYRVTRLEADAMWRRRLPMEIHGTPAYVLAPEDEVVLLCSHAGKPHHNFSRLIWMADLAMATGWWDEHGVCLDWQLVARRAVDGGCTGVVAAALAMARRAGVQSPPGLLALPAGPVRSRTIRHVLREAYPLNTAALPGYRLQYALADTWWRRLRILTALLASGHRLGTRGRSLRSRLRSLSRRMPGATATS